jgi:hypothetical protein
LTIKRETVALDESRWSAVRTVALPQSLAGAGMIRSATPTREHRPVRQCRCGQRMRSFLV